MFITRFSIYACFIFLTVLICLGATPSPSDAPSPSSGNRLKSVDFILCSKARAPTDRFTKEATRGKMTHITLVRPSC
ncbi:hypothetical protein PGTUg99_018014 [Puccinia graminis f. sp. tritici]|uniref:Secreted protein n=1 Tax=Puccinia graminis f. sp. tritici TaxID=56615 RepID=A0A5B0Q4J2_PUCGR|nr:hypothetical protein PGTUg99_018014 [Puccinia graminis f. sp. tritici]